MAPCCLFAFSSGTCKISVPVGTVYSLHWLVAEEMKFLLKNLFVGRRKTLPKSFEKVPMSQPEETVLTVERNC